jgi:hypothetical protein
MTQNPYQAGPGPSPFTKPGAAGGGTYIDNSQLHGRLLLIEIRSHTQQQSTMKGAAPGTMVGVATCDVTVLDGPAITHRVNKDTGQPEAELDAPVVPGELSAILKGHQFWGVPGKQLADAGGPGTLVLVRGRIGERRGGFNPPFLLDDPTPEDETRGMAWLERKLQLMAQAQLGQVQRGVSPIQHAQQQFQPQQGAPGTAFQPAYGPPPAQQQQQFPGQVTPQEWQQAGPQGYAQPAPPATGGAQPWAGQPQAPNPYVQPQATPGDWASQ